MIWEHKTGKRNYIAINQNAKNALYLYFMEKNPDPEEYVFSKRTNPYKPLSRSQAYRIIKEDASHTTSEEAISCHSPNVLQINIQIDKILFVLFNSKVTFRDMKRRMVKNIH